MTSVTTRLFISAAALTRTTDLVARRTGAASFLPQLFVLRFVNMGGLDPAVFTEQLAEARSFGDERWCAYWDAIAEQHLTVAESTLGELVGSTASGWLAAAARLGAQAPIATSSELRTQLAPVIPALADHGLRGDGQDGSAARAVDAWLKAITYYQVSAFPGHTPARTRAYWRSRRLFDALLTLIAPSLGGTVELVEIPVDGDVVRGYLVLPEGPGPHPMALVSNGLEGTAQELLIPLLKYRGDGLGVFVMEMPGTYVYQQPMTGESERIYHQVIDHLTEDKRIDADRIGMVGVSFGAYWSTRMPAADPRLRCAVSCGALTHISFQTTQSIGTPEIIMDALRGVTHARGLLDLTRKLGKLSLRDTYRRIDVPLLVINGDHDTLCSTQDSIELAEVAPHATLTLYPDDDHCAMGHYDEWVAQSHTWLREQLRHGTEDGQA